MFKVRGVICDIELAYENNHRLILDPRRNARVIKRWERAHGAEYVKFRLELFDETGILPFPGADFDVKEVGDYKTVFGPHIYSGSICYTSRSVANLSKALTRITSKRFLDVPGLCDQLRMNQDLNFRVDGPGEFSRMYGRYIAHLCFLIRTDIHKLGTFGDSLREAAYKLHDKRKARIQAYTDLENKAVLALYDLFMKCITGKVKCPENAKTGKYPRMVGDYTCPGSLLGSALMEYIKKCHEGWYRPTTDNLQTCFVKSADRSTLVSCYVELWNCPQFTGVYHSDDMCVSIPCTDGVLRMNLDIKSCDASNGSRVFDLLVSLCEGTSWLEVAKGLRDQCMHELKIQNPFTKDDVLYLSNNGEPIEFSGTTLTTELNNLASQAILMSIYIGSLGKSKAEALDVIPLSAQSVGYQVSVELVEKLEDFQFLKTSPFLVNGSMDCFLNLGVVFRCIGSCDGDLPGRGDIEARAEQRNGQIVAGMIHAGDNCVMSALRGRFPLIGGDKKPVHWLVDGMTGFEESRVDMDVLCRRYNVGSAEIEYFMTVLGGAKCGDVVRTAFTDAVYAKDYGYSFSD